MRRILRNLLLSIAIVALLVLSSAAQTADHARISSMPDTPKSLSPRTLRVLFFARLKAGEMGAHRIDVFHIIIGVLMEDQGGVGGNALRPVQQAEGTLAGRDNRATDVKPFFSSGETPVLLSQLEALSPHAQSLPTSQDIPMSGKASHLLGVAQVVAKRCHSDTVEPLHMLAAVMEGEPSSTTLVLTNAGITKARIWTELDRGNP
jgi:hypothetical protein